MTDFVQCGIRSSAFFYCSIYSIEDIDGLNFKTPDLELSIPHIFHLIVIWVTDSAEGVLRFAVFQCAMYTFSKVPHAETWYSILFTLPKLHTCV